MIIPLIALVVVIAIVVTFIARNSKKTGQVNKA
jgi:hypothetical protein